MTLISLVGLNVSAQQSSSLDLGSAAFSVAKAYSSALATGTGAGQADKLFTDTRTISASSSENLDLAGSLADALGATITMARVKGLVISAAAANTNNVLVGGAASNGFITPFSDATDIVVLRPGATLALFAGTADATGYAVTASTGDLLKIANSSSGTSVTYDVIIIGCSA